MKRGPFFYEGYHLPFSDCSHILFTGNNHLSNVSLYNIVPLEGENKRIHLGCHALFLLLKHTLHVILNLRSLVHGIPRPALMASASPAPLYQPLAVVRAFLLGQGSLAPRKKLTTSRTICIFL